MRAITQPETPDAGRAATWAWSGAAIFGSLGVALVTLLVTREL